MWVKKTEEEIRDADLAHRRTLNMWSLGIFVSAFPILAYFAHASSAEFYQSAGNLGRWGVALGISAAFAFFVPPAFLSGTRNQGGTSLLCQPCGTTTSTLANRSKTPICECGNKLEPLSQYRWEEHASDEPA